MKQLILSFCLIAAVQASAQKCPNNSQLFTWSTNSGVTMYACLAKEVSLGAQTVLYGVRNNTGDKLDVRFTKVVTTSCGKVLRNSASVDLKPGEFKGGGTFFGDDITLDTQVWKEDCNHFPNRISRVGYENLQVINVSQKERAREQAEQEAKQKREEEARQREEKARQQKEAEEQARQEKEKEQADREEKQRAYERYQDSMRQVRYQDSLKQIEEDRTQRLERIAEQDNKEKAALAGIATGVAGLAMGDTDNDKTDATFYVKGELALGIDNIPAISNTEGRDARMRWSSHDNINYVGGSGGLYFGLRPIRVVELFAKPFATYGMQMTDGVIGDYIEYGGTAGIKLGGKFKIGAQVQYGERMGSYERDGDAVMANSGYTTNDQLITTANIAYNYLSYGGFLMLETSDETDSYIQLGAGMEKPSISTVEYPYYRARFTFDKFFVEGTYIQNYPLDNKPALYQIMDAAKKDYYNVRLGVVVNL